MEGTKTNGHSEGNFVQELEEMDSQINEYTQFSEVDWSLSPKYDHYDPDEEILELGNQKELMMEEEEIMTIIDDFLSLYPEVKHFKEDDQRIGNNIKNKTCVNQILHTNWIKPLSMVEIQTKVVSMQPTGRVSILAQVHCSTTMKIHFGDSISRRNSRIF